MKFILNITMDNQAFFEMSNGTEVARILHNLADKIDADTLGEGDTLNLFDANGNRVGSATVESK